MLLATLVPKLIGFRACIPRTLSETLSSSSSSSCSGSTTSLNGMSRRLKPITLEESIQSHHVHAAHALLYCKTVDKDVEGFFGLCQVRFDGQLGFPGGIVGKEELNTTSDIVSGLLRELEEEINLTLKQDEVNKDGNHGFVHISSYIDDSVYPSDVLPKHRVDVYHFFAKQITEEEFKEIEAAHTKSRDFPSESLGIFRLPLVDPSNCKENTVFRYYKNRGTFLINFFNHVLAGIGKNQLYDTLVYLNCLTPNYLAELEKYIIKINA